MPKEVGNFIPDGGFRQQNVPIQTDSSSTNKWSSSLPLGASEFETSHGSSFQMPIDFPPSSIPKAIGPANLISKIIFDQAVHKGKPLTPETLQLVNYFHKLFGEKEEEGNYPFILTRGAENPDLETNAVEQDKRSTYGSTSWSYRGDNGMAHVPVIQSIWFLLLGKSYST